MDEEKLLEILEKLDKDGDNAKLVENIKKSIKKGDYESALKEISKLKEIEEKISQKKYESNAQVIQDGFALNIDNINELTQRQTKQIQKTLPSKQKEEEEEKKEEFDDLDDMLPFDFSITLDQLNDEEEEEEESEKQKSSNIVFDDESDQIIPYPKKLQDEKLEETYVGLIITNPKNLSVYSIPLAQNYFASAKLNNLYKLMIFGEGQQYCPEKSKRGYNFTKETERVILQKQELKEKYQHRNIDIKDVYVKLLKLFVLRKYYLANPIENIQKDIENIRNYELYDKMNIEEVEGAVDQILVTQKFKQSILSTNVSDFLIANENNLTTGLKIPFKILDDCFKGFRKGETLSIAMPSNAGKSRLSIMLVAYIALVHNKKVLLISNEMSEDKMKLCLITTILNNSDIQKKHGKKIHISETEILDFKYKPNKGVDCKVDEKGYIVKEKGEKQYDFAKRVYELSDTFKDVIYVTKWVEKQLTNQIYFINIIDHTKDELKKVITNYFYKNHIEYMFYDTMKADTDSIGLEEELKKTATILSNLAQSFEIFIGSTLQIKETQTLPINLSIADLSSCKTVKEVLDILVMFKQIPNEELGNYEYTKEMVSDETFELEKSNDINDRYYACVVDKNRAGAKPKLLFKLNLAYNYWEEVGYLRLKNKY